MDKGYVPVVDFQDNRTQYNMPYMIHGTWNAWEYYFKPISGYKLEEIYKSKNVIVSGRSDSEQKRMIARSVDYSDEAIKKVRDFALQGIIRVNEDIVEEVRHKKEELFHAQGEVLGVFCRGTDYVALKPKGHPVQPQTEDVISKTEEYLERYSDIKKIFLATEDINIYRMFHEKWGVNV